MCSNERCSRYFDGLVLNFCKTHHLVINRSIFVSQGSLQIFRNSPLPPPPGPGLKDYNNFVKKPNLLVMKMV